MTKYEDILFLKRPKSNHPCMPMQDRACQFAPFAALNGYEESLQEARRMTEEKIQLSEDQEEEIKRKLDFLIQSLQKKQTPIINLMYFIPDLKKSGGQYIHEKLIIKKYDEYNHTLVSSTKKIPLDNIYDIEILSTV